MASNLRVDSIVPATGSSVSIGTATGGVNIPGVLTYEDVTNVDSIGIVTARGGIRIGTGGTVGPVGSGIVTYYGDGSQLTGAGPTFTNGADNRVITATSASAITGESNLIFTGTRLGLNKTSPAPLNGDGTGMIHVAGGNPELVLERTTSGTESKASIRVTDGEDFKIAVKDGSGSTIDALAIDTGTGAVTKPANPSFRATASSSLDYTSDNTLQFQNEKHDVGGYYNNSNSYYTIPTTGYYKFEVMHFAQPGQIARVQLERSTDGGSSWSTIQIGPRIESSGGGRYIAGWMHVFHEFTATNLVRVRWSQGNVHINNGYGWFQGWLVQ
jgi:hypothetical protein